MNPLRRLLAGGLLTTALAGCVGGPQAFDEACCDQLAARPALPPLACRHVHIFLLNGVDPRGAATLGDLKDACRELGFGHTYHGQIYHRGWCERELARVCRDDPDARLVLIGHDCAASLLRDLGHKVVAGGAHVDVLLVVSGSEAAVSLDGAFPERALASGSDVERRSQLAWELGQAASRVVVPETVMPLPEFGPTPRQVVPQTRSYGPDWDSLQPTAHLRAAR